MSKRLFLDKENKQFVLVSWSAEIKKHTWWDVEYADGYTKIVSSTALKNNFEEIKLGQELLDKIYCLASSMLENPVIDLESGSDDWETYYDYVGRIFQIASVGQSEMSLVRHTLKQEIAKAKRFNANIDLVKNNNEKRDN